MDEKKTNANLSEEEYLRKKSEYRKRKLRKQQRERKKRIRAILIAFLILFAILLIMLVKALAGFLGSMFTKEPEPTPPQPKTPQTYKASILSAGDVVPHSPFIESTVYKSEDGTYDYHSIFKYVKDSYTSADYSIVNLECTISEGDYSGHPLFKAPDALAAALAQNGVDMCLLANNHIYDNFDEGLSLTSNALKNNALAYTGIRNTTDATTYTVQDINGINVGIFNYTYETDQTNGQKTINAIPVSASSAPLINSFNYNDLETFYQTIQSDMEAMKQDGVEYTIAYIHWGTEYELTESDIQREMAQKLCDLGIDILIGSHPHAVQPVDLLTNDSNDHQMVCLYSVGNHVSNQLREYIPDLPNGHSEDGLMVKISLEQTDDGPVSLHNVEFLPTWTYCQKTKDGSSEYFILPVSNPESITETASDLDISSEAKNSLERTNKIIKEGVSKVQAALPITNK